MDLKEIIIETLEREVVAVTGCTEPVAVTLACAKAREILEDRDIIKANILVSPNIYKNGLAVGVPHTGEVGLEIAAALGLVNGKSKNALAILDFIDNNCITNAKKLINKGRITLAIKDVKDKVYIEVNLYCTSGKSKVIIKGKHDNFVYLQKDDNVLLDKNSQEKEDAKSGKCLFDFPIKNIINTILTIPHQQIVFLLEGIEINEKIADYGLTNKVGMEVGLTLKRHMEKGILSDDIMNTAKMLTAAASDTRMSGVTMPVMSSNGSGNNGLTAILPIVAYKNKFVVSDEKLAQALAISHIINSYIKHYIGRLSVLCGCGVAAGTGAGVAITFLMGGTVQQMEYTIKNIIGDISGMICDGAKVGCALKLSTSASVAVQGALLAIENKVIPDNNGIIANSVEETIQNLRLVATEGMDKADGVILKAMQKQLYNFATYSLG